MNGTADGISKDVITGESLTGLNKTKNGAFKMREENKNTGNTSIIRVHKNKNFTIISNEALFEKPPLSMSAKGLLCFMLALPDDWNYSIDGLVAVSKEGRHAVKSTLKELKERGYLIIEKISPNKSKSGRFEYIYHIYETKQKDQKQEVGFQPLEIQVAEIQSAEIQELENQPNNKELINQNTNKQITNQLTFVKTDEAVFTCKDLFELYKSICIHFPQPRELTESRRLKVIKRLKENPKKEFWEEVFRKAEKSVFIRNNNFFSFDWILKNDTNALKVYEGRYNGQEIKEENPSDKYDGGKYAKCYG